jgi:hypothetical protein
VEIYKLRVFRIIIRQDLFKILGVEEENIHAPETVGRKWSRKVCGNEKLWVK